MTLEEILHAIILPRGSATDPVLCEDPGNRAVAWKEPCCEWL
jgi:hypothetical protein